MVGLPGTGSINRCFYLRHDSKKHHVAVVIFNFAAMARNHYRVGVPLSGSYREALNSDAFQSGGAGVTNKDISAVAEPHMGQPCSLLVDLPPLAGLVLVPC